MTVEQDDRLVIRQAVPWKRLGGIPLLFIVVYELTRSLPTVALAVTWVGVVFLLRQRVRLAVTTDGVEAHGFVRTRRLRCAEIDEFRRTRLSGGKPGFHGSVVVDGRPHELLALAEPWLDHKLGSLNEAVTSAECGQPVVLDGMRWVVTGEPEATGSERR